MATRIHDRVTNIGDHVDRLGEYLVAGVFWLGVTIAAIVAVLCGLLALISILY